MKINFVQTIIAIVLSLLIAYGLYSFHDSENKILLSTGSFVFIATTLVLSIGISFQLPRTTINTKVISGIFFAVALISNLIFTFIKFSVPSYVIINGILLLVFILIAYLINKSKQQPTLRSQAYLQFTLTNTKTQNCKRVTYPNALTENMQQK